MPEGRDVVLPAFELDCRDWLVVTPSEAGLAEELDGAPLLAVLSTVVIDDDLVEATGALTVGLLEEDDELLPLLSRPVAPGCAAYELLDFDGATDAAVGDGTDRAGRLRRYVIPAPGGFPLALLAEFVVAEDVGAELDERVRRLMTSFRWQAA